MTAILVMAWMLVACTRSNVFSLTPDQPLATSTALPTEIPIVSTPTASPESPTPSIKPTPAALDHHDPMSLLTWIDYGVETGSLDVFAQVAHTEVFYGIYATEAMNPVPKERFLEDLSQRSANFSQCRSYTYEPGTINILRIFTANWSPEWNFGGKAHSTALVFEVSDEWTGEMGLYLVGAYVVPAQFQEGTPCP